MRAVLGFAFLVSLCAGVYAIPAQYESAVTPVVKPYRVPDGLQGVRHLEKAPRLSAAQRKALVERGFVVIPDRVEQMFFLYEDYGEDYEAGPMPNFITVDSVLQAYHVLFDFALRRVEEEKLAGLCASLTHFCAGASARQVAEAPNAFVREAASRNLAYFLVARSLLNGEPPRITADLPGRDAITAMAEGELAKVKAHAGRADSALMGRTVHYDQFVPRGHYTRSETLSKYFMAMMWYGLLGFELEQPADDVDLIRRHTLQALLIVRGIQGNDWARSLWERIYEPTCFLVGTADDLTWKSYLGVPGSLEAMLTPDGVDAFIAEARRRLPAPRIAPAFLQVDEAGNYEDTLHPPPQGRQFRFMGQRFIPDSYALQQLVYPLVGREEPNRFWPMGLDVMAVLGSARARSILTEQYQQDEYENYAAQLAKVTAEFSGIPAEEWWQNTYYGWLNSLRPLFPAKGDGYPTFMRSEAWLDKELVTALGSWAQLRHDTILYGKPSGAELGGAEPQDVQGYVEPYPEVFGRLCYLARLLRDGLKEQDLLSERISGSCGEFGGMLMFLKQCAEKHLRDLPLSREEYSRIQFFGGELERLTLSVATDDEWLRWHEITNETDRHIATIADIHTSYDECLEVGPGWAYRIYVVVPHPAGGLQLAKGGVMSYHEFKWPVADRLTDEKWLEMLKGDTAPPMQEWTRSFIVP